MYQLCVYITLYTSIMCRCIEVTHSDLCSINDSLTGHQIIYDNPIKQLEVWRKINTNKTCRQFYTSFTCFYAFRDCDPNDGGSQLTICEDVCPCISQLYNKCINPHIVQSLIETTTNLEFKQFLEITLSFNCTKKETYILQEVNVSESCVTPKVMCDLPGIINCQSNRLCMRILSGYTTIFTLAV